MNRFASVVAVILFALASTLPRTASAQDMPSGEHKSIGLGFRNSEAPVGVRWWLAGQKVGVDLGVGFSSESAFFEGYPDDNTTSLAFEVGIPIVVKSWSRFHFLFRPGFMYQKDEVVISDATAAEPFATDDIKTIRISGELEAEYFLVDNVSVSAAHGLAYESTEFPGVDDKFTSFSTVGDNFTSLGFHVYLFGGDH